jgi:hypothetical protein
MVLAGCGSVRELDRTWVVNTPESEPSVVGSGG